MAKFIENVNMFMSYMKIKQTYVSMKSGIDTKKLSRILSGNQEIGISDMEKISDALGAKIEYFLEDDMILPQLGDTMQEKISFYAGNPTKKQEDMAMKLCELIENIDIVMSSKKRFMNVSED